MMGGSVDCLSVRPILTRFHVQCDSHACMHAVKAKHFENTCHHRLGQP